MLRNAFRQSSCGLEGLARSCSSVSALLEGVTGRNLCRERSGEALDLSLVFGPENLGCNVLINAGNP